MVDVVPDRLHQERYVLSHDTALMYAPCFRYACNDRFFQRLYICRIQPQTGFDMVVYQLDGEWRGAVICFFFRQKEIEADAEIWTVPVYVIGDQKQCARMDNLSFQDAVGTIEEQAFLCISDGVISWRVCQGQILKADQRCI